MKARILSTQTHHKIWNLGPTQILGLERQLWSAGGLPLATPRSAHLAIQMVGQML